MDKHQIIALIEGQLAAGKISKEDLLIIAGIKVSTSQNPSFVAPENNRAPDSQESSKKLINTFYGIGATIAITGVGILIGQNWIEIGFAGRILSTMGISLSAYITAFLLSKPQQKMLSQVLFAISAILAPLGSYVLLNEGNIAFDWSSQITTSLLLSIVFGTALLISKRSVLILVVVGFASWAYFALVAKVFGSAIYYNNSLQWAIMLLGTSYIFISYGLQSFLPASDVADVGEKKTIQNVLYGFGTLAILGSGIFVGGIFDLFFIALIFGAFYGSVYLKSRSMLIFGALFLVAHMIKLTSEYFLDSVGWPLALIVIGFLVIGVGYLTFYLNKKFISPK